MKFVVSESGFPLPVGQFHARFMGLVEQDNKEAIAKFGPGYKLTFDPVGEHTGKDVYISTSTKFSTKSKLYGFASQMSGGALSPGEEFDFADYVHKSFLLTVGPKPEGEGNTIIIVSPLHP
jgi:hypothetical protein